MPRTVAFLWIGGEVGLGDDRLEPMLTKFILAKGACEEAPFVRLALEIKDEGALEPGFGKNHDRLPL
jgi:hypothetical protein